MSGALDEMAIADVLAMFRGKGVAFVVAAGNSG